MWQLIKTASRDNDKPAHERYIIGIVKDHGFLKSVHVCFWDDNFKCWWDDVLDEVCYPTHWMHCPNMFKI